MAWWDILKAIRQNNDEERRRDAEGGIKNRIFGFLDDTLDVAGDTGKFAIERGKDVVGGAAGLGREFVIKPATTLIASAEEKQQDNKKKTQLELIEQLKSMKPEERDSFIKNDPLLSRRYKDGKLSFTETTAPWLFGNILADKKTMAEVDVKDNEALSKLTAQINDMDASNDKGRQSTNFWDRQVFGNEPIQAYQNRYEGLRKEGWSAPLAFAGTSANVVLDSPISLGTDDALKAIGKEGLERLGKAKTVEEVGKLLDGKLAKEAIEKIAPTIAGTTDTKTITGLIRNASPSIQKRIREGKTKNEMIDEFLKTTVPKPPKNVNKLADPEEELLSRIKSTSDVEDMKPDKPFAQNLYERWFNKNASFDRFKQIFKARTGEDLAGDADPAVLLQLAGGNDAAAQVRIAGVSEALKNSGNLDDVRKLGVARQILDRADKMPEETVALARRTIESMNGRLSPEQLTKADEAVKAVNDFYDQSLQELVSIGRLSPEAYEVIKEANPNYFGKINLVEHILESGDSRFGLSGSHNQAREKIIKAVKGIGSDDRFVITDPIENIVRSAQAVQKAVSDTKIFDAIKAFEEVDPDNFKTVRASEDVLKRIGLSLENKELRPVRNKIDRMITTRSKSLRRLESQINQLEKKGLNISLKEGGKTPTPNFSVEGLGGKVPTSKAGKEIPVTPGEDMLMKSIDGEAAINPSKLGPKDTGQFVRSLIEGPNTRIEQLKKMVGTRDTKASALLDEIASMKTQYDEIAQRIAINSEDAKALMDKEVPKGMKVISAIKNGVVERVAVPEEIYNTFAGLNDAQKDIVSKTALKVGRVIKEAVTTYNPAFAFIRNPIRDVAQSAFTSKEIPVKDYALVIPYAKRWMESFIGAVTNDEIAQKLAKAGAGGAGQFARDLDPQRYAERLAREANGVKITNVKDFLKEIKYQAGKVPEFLRKQGANVEMATRGAEARAALKNNKSIEEAAQAARNVSVDFSLGGKDAQVVNMYMNFFNARLQGTKNVLSAIKRDPKRASAVITSGIAIPTTVGYIHNMTNFPDVYEQISQDVKDNNFILVLGNGTDEDGKPNQFIKIPKNDIQKIFANATETALRIIRDENPEDFQTVATKMFGNLLPIDVVKDGEFNLSRAVGSALPTIASVPAQLATGKNLYYDSPIVPRSLENLPAEQQFRENTSPIDKFVASVLPGEQSPLKVEAARRGLTGNIISNPVDQLGGSLSGGSANAPQNAFYEIYGTATEKRASASQYINDAISRGDYAEARRTAEAYNAGLQQAFTPWVERYGKYATPELNDMYKKLKINLTKGSIQQRRKNALEKAGTQ